MDFDGNQPLVAGGIWKIQVIAGAGAVINKNLIFILAQFFYLRATDTVKWKLNSEVQPLLIFLCRCFKTDAVCETPVPNHFNRLKLQFQACPAWKPVQSNFHLEKL